MTEHAIYQLAALLADPQAAGESLSAQMDGAQIDARTGIGELLDILHRNKIPLLSIQEDQGPIQAALCAHPDFVQARDAEQARHDGLRREYLVVQAQWRRGGIQDVVIKSSGTRPSFPYKTGNLDLLVPHQDGDNARLILRRNGYVELRNVEENKKYLFRLFRLGQEVSGIHVHEHVGWYASFVDEEHLLAHSQAAPDDAALRIPSPEDIFLTTASHFFYEDKEVKLSDLATIHRCVRQPGFDWDHVAEVATRRGWVEGLHAIVLLCAHLDQTWYGHTPIPQEILACSDDALPSHIKRRLDEQLADRAKEWPHRIPFSFSKRLFYKRLWDDPEKGFWGRATDLIIHTLQGIKLRLRIHSQPAMLIAFSGTDGSGKTAQAEMLRQAFQGCHIRAEVAWSRGGSSKMIGWISKLAKSRGLGDNALDATEDEAAIIARRKRSFQKPLVRWAWGWLTALEMAALYTWRVRLPLWRGHVVICDRYLLDAYAEWGAYFGIGDRIRKTWPARLLRWVSPRPRIAYLLDVPARDAKGRASTSPTVEFMAEQSSLYRQLAADSRATVVDASRPLSALADEIAFDTLTTYFDRYRTWLNAIFFRNPRPAPGLYSQPHGARPADKG